MSATTTPTILMDTFLIEFFQLKVNAISNDSGFGIPWRCTQEQIGLASFQDKKRSDSFQESLDFVNSPQMPVPLNFGAWIGRNTFHGNPTSGQSNQSLNQYFVGVSDANSHGVNFPILMRSFSRTVSDPSLTIHDSSQPFRIFSLNGQRSNNFLRPFWGTCSPPTHIMRVTPSSQQPPSFGARERTFRNFTFLHDQYCKRSGARSQI